MVESYIIIIYNNFYQHYNVLCIIGHENYSCDYDDQDFQLCQQIACDKPQPTIQEFMDLAEIVMEEENLDMPTTPQEALALYIDLVENITHPEPYMYSLLVHTI